MDVQKKLELISASPTEEIVTPKELKELLQTNDHPLTYDGFEPSGIMGIHSGLMRAVKLQDMLDAGCRFMLFMADWHAMLNNKLGGNLNDIHKAGEYFIHGWKACGVDTSKVDVKWVSDEVKDPEYWKIVVNVARNTTVKRITRCSRIMGREEGELQHVAQLLYPAMQVADMFYLNIDIAQLGMDQRKANMLARELAPKMGFKKPVAVHHHLLMGLKGAAAMECECKSMEDREKFETSVKMSKSIPSSCITIHDTPAEIKSKLNSAFCPEKRVEFNPVMELCEYVIFKKLKELKIERPAKFGGTVSFYSYDELRKAYVDGKLHPTDLKNGVSTSLVELLSPVQKYFDSNREARELLEFMQGACITR